MNAQAIQVTNCGSLKQGFSRKRRPVRFAFLAVSLYLTAIGSTLAVQDESREGIISQSELERLVAESQAEPNAEAKSQRPRLGGMSFLELLMAGGGLMIPIGLMSLIVVTVSLERWFALRRTRLFPRRLRREIRRVINDEDEVSPMDLYRVAELFPSAAERVLKDIIAKVGRPIPEIESTIGESIQREADKLHGNVRWLNLAAAVTPLIGLLGTVWGMIIAFYNTTQLASGSNRAETLAEGIYIALVTTLAALSVAIPAAILAHYFEGRITKNLGVVDDELRRLTPRFEPYEGRARFDITSRGISQRPMSGVAVPPPISDLSNAPVRSPKLKQI